MIKELAYSKHEEDGEAYFSMLHMHGYIFRSEDEFKFPGVKMSSKTSQCQRCNRDKLISKTNL